MILVDSSVWIDFLNNKSSPLIRHLEALVYNSPHRICVADIVVMEVLQGFRSDSQVLGAKSFLELFKIFSKNDLSIFYKAIDIYRALRKKGIIIHSSIDTVIAAIAVENKLELLTIDRDFQEIAKVVPLKLVKV